LLDDVMSELDKKRQSYVVDSINGIQTFITTTDKEIFDSLEGKDISYAKVIGGTLVWDSV